MPSIDQGSFAQQLGEVLRQQREAQGMSQRDAALLIGIEPSKLCRWERGTLEVSVFQLLQWSRAMGCQVGELVAHVEQAL
jgi:transcriptional regulator with XRE-family HTH domain